MNIAKYVSRLFHNIELSAPNKANSAGERMGSNLYLDISWLLKKAFVKIKI